MGHNGGMSAPKPALLGPLELARRTGAPAGWLLDEAAAGRLPCLRAGDRYLFDAALIERELRRRAAGETPGLRPAREEVRDAAGSQ